MGYDQGDMTDPFLRDVSTGQYFNITSIIYFSYAFISLYHGDSFSSVETPAKCLLLAYIVINIGNFAGRC